MNATDVIEIRRLQISTHIGVPDEERAAAQKLLVTIRMTPSQPFDGLADDIYSTVDYHAVSIEIEELAASRPRNLIETLAVDIVNHLLTKHPLRHAAVTIEKHILPNTECVAVHVERSP
jgi:dihydroneopterin aldolase